MSLDSLWNGLVELRNKHGDGSHSPSLDELVGVVSKNYDPGGDLPDSTVTSAIQLRAIANGVHPSRLVNDHFSDVFEQSGDVRVNYAGKLNASFSELEGINERIARGRIYLNLAEDYANADMTDRVERLYLNAVLTAGHINDEARMDVAEIITRASRMNFFTPKLLRGMAYNISFTDNDKMDLLLNYAMEIGNLEPIDFYNEMRGTVNGDPVHVIKQYIVLHHDISRHIVEQGAPYGFANNEHPLSGESIRTMINNLDASRNQYKENLRQKLQDPLMV